MKLLGFKDETGNSNDSLDYCWTWGLGGRPLNLDNFILTHLTNLI